MNDSKMHLAGYVLPGPAVDYQGLWRHPDTDPKILDLAYYTQLATTLERGKFDMLFFADTLTVFATLDGDFRLTVERGGTSAVQLDPLVVLSALTSSTRHLGLAGTMSATFVPPYQLARLYATLDHLSDGRAAWNIVTSFNKYEALNMGLDDLPPHDKRYDLADEFLEACSALWDTWADDALLLDTVSGTFADPSKIRRADYKGEWYSTRGPLSVPRSPQGRPVLMQAGGSPRGREFAARWAEVVFTNLTEIGAIGDFCTDMRERAAKLGRDPERLRILPSVLPVVGETTEIARERREAMASLVDPRVGLSFLSGMINYDLSQHPLDEPVPDVSVTGSKAELAKALVRGRKEKLTLGEVGSRYAMGESSAVVVGTPLEVADQMEAIFRRAGCDGFLVCPFAIPGAYTDFVTSVVPELQRRDLFREDYDGTTLRDHLELERPQRAKDR